MASNGHGHRRPGNHLSRDAQRAFKKRLAKIRGKRSRNVMNREIGLAPNMWRGYELGHSLPGLVTLAKLHKAERVDLNWLVSGRRS